MAKPEFALRRTIIEKVTKKAFALTKPRIPSKTLRGALFWKMTPRPRGFLEVPHYWAVYYHEGVVGPIRPRRAKWLVWFSNKLDDPRLTRGKGPQRAIEIKRLTKDQWEDGLRRNYLRRRRGLKPFMVVVKSRVGFLGIPFYVHALGGGRLLNYARDVGQKEFGKYIRNLVRETGAAPIGKVEVIRDRIRL